MNTLSRTLRRRTTAASAALLLGLTLAACGGSDGTDATDTPSPRTSETTSEPAEPTTEVTEETTDAAPADVPSVDELTAALLTATDLPEGFAQQPASDDDDTAFEGTCLADIGKFSDAIGYEPDSEAKVDFGLDSDAGQSSVTTQIEAYADSAALAPAFADFIDSLQSCTSVETTDDQGITYKLKIAYDDSVDLPGADDQLRFELNGSIAAEDQTYDVTYRFEVALIGPFVSVVGTYALGEDAAGVLDMIDALATLQAGRVGALG